MTRRTTLPPKQQRFVERYLVCLNSTQAYQEAYGCSLKVADANGPRLLGNARIAAIVSDEIAKRAKKAGMDADEVLHRIAHIGRVDVADAYDDNNCLKPLREIPEEIRLSIAGIETEEIYEWTTDNDGKRKRELVGYTKKIKFWDKKGSLELLGRHHKLFTDVVKHEGFDELADAMRAAEERIKTRDS